MFVILWLLFVLLLTFIHVFLDLFSPTCVSLFFPSSFCLRGHQSYPALHCDRAPPAAQDFGGVGSWGSTNLPVI